MIGRRPKTELERALGYRFRDRELLERALTHRSYANEQSLERHNERLEFLGDAVLGLVAGEWLFRAHPELPEGDLSKLKAFLVSAPALAGFSGRLGVGGVLRIGVGEERSGGRGKRSLLADANTRLQEEVQSRGWDLPEYHLVAEVGPDHDKRFTVECRVRESPAGRGEGRSKKAAEQRAAAEALDALLAAESVEEGGGEPVA